MFVADCSYQENRPRNLVTVADTNLTSLLNFASSERPHFQQDDEGSSGGLPSLSIENYDVVIQRSAVVRPESE